MAKGRDLSRLDKYFHHIYTVPGKVDDDRKYEELWCNNRAWKVEKLPTVSGTRATHCMVTETSFSKEKLSLWERSAMEEDYLQIAKTNIRREPYDLVGKVFHKKDYEATTRVFIDALVTRITQHNMLHFSSVDTPYKLCQEAQQTEATKKSKVQRTDTFRKSEPQQTEAAKEYGAHQRDATKNVHYIIKDINGPIGVVEAKRAKSLIKASITQCVEQLLDIQQEIKDKGRNIPLFGIVTDALHFVFIKLNQDGLFEFEKDDIESYKVKVHRANTWDDFHEITEIFNGLCQLHKQFVSPDSLICETHLLPPENVVCEGYVFRRVCHSVHSRGNAWQEGGSVGGMCGRGGHAWGDMHGRGACVVGACMAGGLHATHAPP